MSVPFSVTLKTRAAQGAVSEEVYTQLADKYDSLRNDYSLFRTLLIAAIVVALIFMVLLIVSVTGKKKKSSSAEKKTARSEKKPVKRKVRTRTIFMAKRWKSLKTNRKMIWKK